MTGVQTCALPIYFTSSVLSHIVCNNNGWIKHRGWNVLLRYDKLQWGALSYGRRHAYGPKAMVYTLREVVAMDASGGVTMSSEEPPERYQETPGETIQQVMKDRGYMYANEFRTWLDVEKRSSFQMGVGFGVIWGALITLAIGALFILPWR